MSRLTRLAHCLAVAVVVFVAACTPSPSSTVSAPVVPFLDRLPLLTDLPDLASLTYRVPAERGFFKDDDRWSDCGHYPEVGDLSKPGVQAEYEAPIPGHGDWPVFFVRLRPALPEENIAAELSDWTQRCTGGELETLNPRMPFGASLLTLHGPGVGHLGPPAVKIVAASSKGVAFEAWAQTDWRDGFRFEAQLGYLARSFLRNDTPSMGKPVGEWTPAELSRLFVFTGQQYGSIDIAYATNLVESRNIPPPDKECEDDPLHASGYAGVSSSDQPEGVDALVEYGGRHPDKEHGLAVTVVYREHAGFDGLTRVRDWISLCQARPTAVPQICSSSGWSPQFIPQEVKTVEGAEVFGYQRFDPLKFGGGHAGHPSCGAKAKAARTVRVGGLLIHTEMAVDATDGPPHWAPAVAPLDEQVVAVIKAIQHAN